MFEFFAPIFQALKDGRKKRKDNQGYERIILTKVIGSKWTGNSTDIKINSINL